ncbi:MAG: glycine--tRNA ligase subunit beta, partial [Candidatus Margulisiibacteriota bacterium]|nr:glycine--tRNA ligase subunit beta [Candidatus Margulisiibacteriota bacterium]
MSSFLLEIGLEEVPARFINTCLNDLQSLILKNLTSHRLVNDQTSIQSYGTYRRFIIKVDHLLDKQDDIDQQVDGPPVAIAKSESGDWLPPAIGFAKKMNANPDDLIEIKNKKGQSILALQQFIVGESAFKLLPSIIEDSVYAMKLPIAMKWGTNTGPFIRPIKWICALLNDSVISVDLFGVKSSNLSYGHRFLTKGNDSSTGKEIKIDSASDYISLLDSHHVIIDAKKRQQLIVDQLLELNAFSNESEIDSALLQEVCFLVEKPTVLGVPFDESFLQLPKEVLVECLKKHQKAFLAPDNDHVKNTCYIVADSITEQNKSSVIDGNKRVMLARLNDVQFFWDEDLKENGFGHWNDKLFNIVFQDGLGSIGDKVERVCHICHTIMDQLDTDKQARDMVDRAAHRAKADLVSQMVGELPSLQGTMGGYYGLLFKEDPDVSIAIADHYKPRFEGDEMPSSIGGV